MNIDKEQKQAKKIIDKIYFELNANFPENPISYKQAKYMASICVDEIILGYEFDSLVIEDKRIMDKLNFWDKVKFFLK